MTVRSSKKYYVIYALLLLISCKKQFYINDRKVEAPPGTIGCNVNDNLLFVDKCEISHGDWCQYKWWKIQRKSRSSYDSLRGFDLNFNLHLDPDVITTISNLHDTALLLNSVFRMYSNSMSYEIEKFESTFDTIHDDLEYFKSRGSNDINYFIGTCAPVNAELPVLGISQEQAEAYCRWRSDRVFESMLYRSKAIEFHVNQNFTRHSYLVQHPVRNKFDKNILIPIYRLPTIEEWEEIARPKINLNLNDFGIDTSSRKMKRYLKRNKAYYNTVEFSDSNLKTVLYKNDYIRLFYRMQGAPNVNGLYNLFGNVAEMTTSDSMAKGGSYLHRVVDCSSSNVQIYDSRAIWLGFRCVCELVTPEEYMKSVSQGFIW